MSCSESGWTWPAAAVFGFEASERALKSAPKRLPCAEAASSFMALAAAIASSSPARAAARLCGLRVGYGLGPEELRQAFDKVRQPFNVNRLAQAAAICVYTNTNVVVEEL